MTYLRRATPLALTIMALAPTMAHAAVTCGSQPALTAWAGSPRTLQLAPNVCHSNQPSATVSYTVLISGAHGTATAPAATGTFTFTADFNPNGADYTGADAVSFTASDGTLDTAPLTVPITIAPAPLLHTMPDSPSLQEDAPLQDGTPTWDVFYKDPTTLTSSLTDGPVTPLPGYAVRHRGVPGGPKLVQTDAAGAANLPFRPLSTQFLLLDVPALPGVLAAGGVLFVAPDWSLSHRLPIRHKRFVITGRLVAEKFARSRGTVSFQRRKGTKWVNVTRKVKLSASLRFTVTLSTKYSGKRVRLVYTPRTPDYITSTFTFTPKVKKRLAGRVAAGGVRAMHR
jgi:hypothetical protein